MKVYLLVTDDGGCGDPECCGCPSYYYSVFSTEELAKHAAGNDKYPRIEELTMDEGV